MQNKVNGREFGGYLSLELSHMGEFFAKEHYVRRYNSGRSGIYQAFQDSGAERIWLPVYLCSSVKEFLQRKNVKMDFYNIDYNFFPSKRVIGENDILLWVNYFGINGEEQTQKIIRKYRNVILDNTQAFFSAVQGNVYNVFSCRKFFGVSDGAYLVKDTFKKQEEKFPPSRTLDTIEYLFSSVEKSTNSCYEKNLENERRLETEDIMAMSQITRKILEGIDYKSVASRRLANFKVLHEYLGKYNQLDLSTVGGAPMIYPLLVRDIELRDYLVKRQIYIPQWWKAVKQDIRANEWEKYLSEYLFPLPIDQRYTESDMIVIKDIVIEGIKE